jgi:predicted O-methyltransferase YrrM
MRYDQLIDAVRQKAPNSILEIGTWDGRRAMQMLAVAPEGCQYHGFDLFEDATRETDAIEKNVKPHHYMEQVLDRLSGFNALLYKGNTRETLPAFAPDRPIDFVWIDGGHSVETIRSDWENIKRVIAPDAWVFFDDYYTGSIDTSKFGCNLIIADLKHEILPHKDLVAGGGFVQMVRVYP